MDGRDRTERRTAGDANDPRLGQRIAQVALQHRTRKAEHPPMRNPRMARGRRISVKISRAASLPAGGQCPAAQPARSRQKPNCCRGKDQRSRAVSWLRSACEMSQVCARLRAAQRPRRSPGCRTAKTTTADARWCARAAILEGGMAQIIAKHGAEIARRVGQHERSGGSSSSVSSGSRPAGPSLPAASASRAIL